jgi:prepilin-type N-terminal cleavage/methylation domain-containing protein
MNQRGRATERRGGFTLVEMLVTIAVIAILISILVPTIGPAMERARQASCSSNLGQCFKMIVMYATDNGGRLPQANGDDPTTFRSGTASPLPGFMKRQNLPSAVWYCPSLMRQNMAERGKQNWQNPPAAPTFRIGYAYIAAPMGDVTRFKQVGPLTASDLHANRTVLADICASPQSATSGRDVTQWTVFPHAGPQKPKLSKVCTGDGGVQTKEKESLLPGYAMSNGTELYW